MRIDIHVHITPPDIIEDWEKIAENEEYFKMLSSSPINKFATGEEIVEELESSEMDGAAVFGFAFNDQGLCRYVNDYTAEMAKKFPGQILPLAIVNPSKPGALKEVDRCVDKGFLGVGELFPDGQGLDIRDKASMKEFAYGMIERDLPLMVHTNEPVGHYYSGKTETTPERAFKLADNFPELELIFAHWGGGLFFYEMMKSVKEPLKNVYYDIAANPFLYSVDIFKVVEAMDIVDKILFGSDFPLLPMKRHENQIIESGISEESKEKIMGLNAKKLLGL